MLDWSRAAHRRPNHVSRASRPADVLARALDRDRQVVSALIEPPFRAGLAAGNIVVPHSAEFGVDVVEDLLWLPRQTEGSTTLSPTQI
jgi:hypothetical protein